MRKFLQLHTHDTYFELLYQGHSQGGPRVPGPPFRGKGPAKQTLLHP